MQAREFRYVNNHEVEEKEMEGWVNRGRMPGHHAERGTLMEKPQPGRRMRYWRGPVDGVMELVIAPGDHTCEVERFTAQEFKNLVFEGMDRWWRMQKESGKL